MKFKKGDVVRYTQETDLCAEFKEKWGRGPFVIDRQCPNDDNGDEGAVFLRTLEGNKLTGAPGGQWRHDPTALVLETFLDAARKAVNGHPQKSPLHRKSKAS